jgi:hypothetical protein
LIENEAISGIADWRDNPAGCFASLAKRLRIVPEEKA